jgi:hypothetical protein
MMVKHDWSVVDKLKEKFTYPQISEMLSIPLQTIKNHYSLENKTVQTDNEPVNLSKSVLELTTKERTTKEICDKLEISENVLKAVINDLKDEGYSFIEINGTIKIYKQVAIQYDTFEENWNGDKIFRFGNVSDTHLCNKWQQLTFLNSVYDRFKQEGIKRVFHSGDIADGYYKNRPGHIYELIPGCVGVDEQADYVIKNYPQREGIQTEFITGNHDHTHILNGGADIGKRIASSRTDMKYLGQANARIKLTPNCILELNHPLDGTAYALSYSIQKYIESYTGGEKPNILLNGHHHKAMYVFYRNVHAFECGTTEDQTPWMKGKRLAAHIGAWIIEVHVNDEGTVTKCVNEFIPLYSPLQNDY